MVQVALPECYWNTPQKTFLPNLRKTDYGLRKGNFALSNCHQQNKYKNVNSNTCWAGESRWYFCPWALGYFKLRQIQTSSRPTEIFISSTNINKLKLRYFYIYIFHYLQGNIPRLDFCMFLMIFFNVTGLKMLWKAHQMDSDHQQQSTMLCYKS